MIATTRDFSPGTVVLAQGQLGRYTEFEQSLDRLHVPYGTKLDRIPSGCCAYGCNMGIRDRIGNWVWFIDDDHTFQPDILLNLLKHDKPLIAPLVPDRWSPFNLVLYRKLGITNDKKIQAIPYLVNEIGTGLMQVEGLPKAGLLAHDLVWKHLTDPWFEIGRIFADQIDDDRYFMLKARNKGFELWADTALVMPHLNTTTIGLHRDGIKLKLHLTVGGYQFPLEPQ